MDLSARSSVRAPAVVWQCPKPLKAVHPWMYDLCMKASIMFPADLAELIDVYSQTGFQIGGFVGVDDMYLGQLVKHLLNGRIQLYSFVLVGGSTELAHGVAHSLCIVLVVQSPYLGLTYSLL